MPSHTLKLPRAPVPAVLAITALLAAVPTPAAAAGVLGAALDAHGGARGALVDGHHRAAEYVDWQTVDGLVVPRRLRFGVWRDGSLVASPAYNGEATFTDVDFHHRAPAAERFAMPEGGAVDPPPELP